MRKSSGFSGPRIKLTTGLERSRRIGRRSAASRHGVSEGSDCCRNEQENRADRFQRRSMRNGTGQNGVRRMNQRMNRATAMAGMPESAFRLFHLGSHGVQVVTGRNHGKQKNQHAAQSAHECDRAYSRTSRRATRSGRRCSLPPQQPRGQQKRKPAKIKKKLHRKCPGPGS